MLNVTLQAPSANPVSAPVVLADGSVFSTNAFGLLSVPSQYAAELLKCGYTYPQAKYVKNTGANAQTAAAGDLTGGSFVAAEYSAVGAHALTVRTAAQMIQDGALQPGATFICRIINSSGGTTVLTADSGATVTLTGHTSLLTGTFVDYLVSVNAAGTGMTFQSIGAGDVP
jgi:hypothetical protein